MKNTQKTHGGKRRGAGAKPTLEDAGVFKVYLDRRTNEIMLRLGKGNRSLGIRLAGEVAESLANSDIIQFERKDRT